MFSNRNPQAIARLQADARVQLQGKVFDLGPTPAYNAQQPLHEEATHLCWLHTQVILEKE
jgi:hypothetical protein